MPLTRTLAFDDRFAAAALCPRSFLGGASFLVLCDALARTALGGPELPVGAITALLGGPLFLLLLRRREGLLR